MNPQCRDDVDVLDFYGAPDWRTLSDEFIIRNYDAPHAFSAEAFQYYVPAFMVWSLKHHDTIQYTPESTLLAFDPDAYRDNLRDFRLSKFALLTPAQRRAIVHHASLDEH